MKCTESWLREWVNPKLSSDVLAHELTMAGLEVEELIPVKNSKNDVVIDLSITPNRGDCLSIQGVAREISAISNTKITSLKIDSVKEATNRKLLISNKAASDCPRYLSRVIEGVDASLQTPEWLAIRLEQAGVRVINPIVDVTNYVMLELGQPMHAFDLAAINKGIVIRHAKQGEKILLLDASEHTLDKDTLLIADEKQPLAIAGVMGANDSGVTSISKDIVLESAFFNPKTVARQRQHYKLQSESAYRFERGVDPKLQGIAIERATQLILEITGGKPGPVVTVEDKKHLPKDKQVSLSKEKLEKVLGIHLDDKKVNDYLTRLSFNILAESKHGWQLDIPSYRFDISIEEDLIEEVIRLYGYDNIPMHQLKGDLKAGSDQGNNRLTLLRHALNNQGFHEIISYSFVDKELQQKLSEEPSYGLLNPISSEMEVMRSSLWPGLINTMLYNKSRQQEQIRLFELGVCFYDQGREQIAKLGGLIMGSAELEQWGIKTRLVDFYDLKGHIENLLDVAAPSALFSFKKSSNKALHPGQRTDIYFQDKKIGVLGALHPSIMNTLGLSKNKAESVFLFEIRTDFLLRQEKTRFKPVSKFPEIRRDIAILLNQAVPSQVIRDTIIETAGDWLKDVFIFDVYEGKGISPGLKSIALAMVFQHPERTLVDDEVTRSVDTVIKSLQDQLGAELRS